jgi:CofH/MqnC-like protein
MEAMTALEMLAERISAGDSMTQADALTLMESRDLISVGMIADEVRRRLHGLKTTFVRVFEVHVDAPPASLPSTLSAGEIRIVGQPESLDDARALVSSLRKLAGATPLTGFSLSTLAALRLPVRETSRQLAEAGLDGVAEVSVDQLTDAGLVSELREGGLHVYRMTVEQYGDRPSTELLQRASDTQNSVGGFRAFAPLSRVLSPVTPTTGYDDVKLVATARVLVGNIPSIQVDWPLYGPKLAQVALTMGADDVDGIAAYDPATLGTRRTALAEIRGNIRAAAQEPIERNGRFQVE